ncbi:hypothetical protein NPIL_59391 [Nephila pilipes]|uniref:Uncharacterized protein n=1 Tax=Nephila pilipes TaxID=299642 RepID=A0A8X6NWQ2_NEPPI|nr:hypothetical protein NPIL_59391 [Nephila pilipes]
MDRHVNSEKQNNMSFRLERLTSSNIIVRIRQRRHRCYMYAGLYFAWPSEEFEIPPSISGYPFIIYPKFPEDDVEEPKSNGKRKYKCQLCGYKPKSKKGKRHHNIAKHKIGVLPEQLPTLDANGRPLNFFSITETVLKTKSETKITIDANASYERQLSWALKESAEMAANR